MRLRPWRGENVLVTDAIGLPILQLDARGNVVEAGGHPVSPYPIELGEDPERLARSVATWILYTAEELGEFRTTDLHPQIRARVAELVPDWVEAAPVP